jgi:23S rRNA (uracil1939-C5)-methyltransferase
VIERLAAGGDGVAHAADGRVVFVPFSAPGDRLRVRAVGPGARFLRARIVALLAPGPARTEPACPVFGRCGGCDWQHVAYAAQLETKREILRDALLRLGRVTLPGDVSIVPSPSPYGYRGRARVRVERGRVGFRLAGSRALCATSRCPVLAPALEAALADLAARPPGDDGEWELALAADGAARATPLGARERARRSRPGAPRAGAGAPLEQRVGEDRIGITPGVFAQANALLWEPLAEAVHTAAGGGALALELFAGAGFFTLGLARRFARVVAVESDAAAVRDLARNLRDAGRPNVEVRREPAERALERWRGTPPSVVVLDPPRGGLGAAGARALVRLGAGRVVHVSCDPATLARDAAVLTEAGYAVTSLRAFDLFPQTAHVEAVMVMERGGGGVGRVA